MLDMYICVCHQLLIYLSYLSIFIYIYLFIYLFVFPLICCRFCRVCAAGLRPEAVDCALCFHNCGALEPAVRSDADESLHREWVHTLCAMRFSELYLLESSRGGRQGSAYCLSSLDQKRFDLKCEVCGGRGVGACIQCRFGKCQAAAHPYCIAQQPDCRFLYGPKAWEVSCPRHRRMSKR